MFQPFEKLTIQNPDIFVRISNVVFFLQNGSHLSGFQMTGLPYFRSHLKSRPYFNHFKSRLVRISDTHCTVIDNYSSDQQLVPLLNSAAVQVASDLVKMQCAVQAVHVALHGNRGHRLFPMCSSVAGGLQPNQPNHMHHPSHRRPPMKLVMPSLPCTAPTAHHIESKSDAT